jgi:hypothetical protein
MILLWTWSPNDNNDILAETKMTVLCMLSAALGEDEEQEDDDEEEEQVRCPAAHTRRTTNWPMVKRGIRCGKSVLLYQQQQQPTTINETAPPTAAKQTNNTVRVRPEPGLYHHRSLSRTTTTKTIKTTRSSSIMEYSIPLRSMNDNALPRNNRVCNYIHRRAFSVFSVCSLFSEPFDWIIGRKFTFFGRLGICFLFVVVVVVVVVRGRKDRERVSNEL